MKTVYPIGTTLYRPGECFNGYTLISGSGVVKLLDMNGRTAHAWKVDPDKTRGFIHRARLMPDGRLMLLFGPWGDRLGHMAEFDWDGTLTWEYTPDGDPHHDFWPKPDGSVLLLCKSPVPREAVEKIKDPARRGLTIYGDTIVEVSRKKRVVWRWRQHEHLDINLCNPIPASRDWPGGPDNNTITDWTHTNTVQSLPENRWFDQGDERFRPGNVLISMRQLDTILIVDRRTGEVAWSYTGAFRGGMSGQHESVMIEKPLPGAGNILVFDNGASPHKDLAHTGRSLVIEVDPPAGQVVWFYEDGHKFYSPFTSNCQRLGNGNTLILEAACRRLFEVTPKGKIVWEHITTDNAQRVYRYPYDHCPQARALPRPTDQAVTPPKELRIPPDGEAKE
jgi:hypothetical protein